MILYGRATGVSSAEYLYWWLKPLKLTENAL